MAKMPNARDYVDRRTQGAQGPSGHQPPKGQGPRDSQPEAKSGGDGRALVALAGAGVLFFIGGPWLAVIGGAGLAAVLYAGDD
jgi:hypothetical protein